MLPPSYVGPVRGFLAPDFHNSPPEDFVELDPASAFSNTHHDYWSDLPKNAQRVVVDGRGEQPLGPPNAAWIPGQNHGPTCGAPRGQIVSETGYSAASDLLNWSGTIWVDPIQEFVMDTPLSSAVPEIKPSVLMSQDSTPAHDGPIHPPTLPQLSSAAAPSVPTRRRRRSHEDQNVNAQYPCEFCPVRMARLHDINRHMRLHTNEKPYECLGCGETFRRSDARVRHWLKSKDCSKAHKEREPVCARVSPKLAVAKRAYDTRMSALQVRQRISLRLQQASGDPRLEH